MREPFRRSVGIAAMHRLDAHIEACLGTALPETLVSRAAYGRIRHVAATVPAAATVFFGFECRLGETSGRADFLLCLHPGAGREVLAGTHPDGDFPEAVLAHPVWRRARDFARRWADPASALHEPVHNAWLEFDLDAGSGKTPVPSVFFGSERLTAGILAGDGGVASNAAWMIEEALAVLRGEPLGPPLRDALVRTLAALPEGARVFQVGVMLARGADGVRLCILGLGDGIVGFLRSAGWRGDPAALAALLAELDGVDEIALDIDVTPGGVHPRVGLECSFDPTLAGHRRFLAFLDGLVERRACLPANRDALLAWPRLIHSRGREEKWPADLLARANAMPTRTVSAFWRWVHHIKLVHEGGGPPRAKAYLAVQQDWLDGPRVRGILDARRQALLDAMVAAIAATS